MDGWDLDGRCCVGESAWCGASEGLGFGGDSPSWVESVTCPEPCCLTTPECCEAGSSEGAEADFVPAPQEEGPPREQSEDLKAAAVPQVPEPGSSVLVDETAPLESGPNPVPDGAPVVHEPLTMDAPTTVSPIEPEANSEPAVTDEPPAVPTTEPEPINIFEAEEGAEASVEPLRRWIHARGNRSLVARLVDLPDAESCLLETAGRRIRVPLEQLSDHDQRYVRRTVERLAAARATAQTRDTAGL